MFEYFGIESALLQSTFRQLLSGILSEKSLDDDAKFSSAILSKFEEDRVSLVLDSEDKSNVEEYLLVTGLILLFDSNYRYTPPD